MILVTDKATFTRTKHRGAVSTITLTRPGLPPIKLNQTELSQALKMEFDVFASCFNVDYFMSLSSSKKKEVVGRIAQVDRRQVLLELTPGVPNHPKVRLENLRVDAQVVATDRRVEQNKLSADQGALVQVESQLREYEKLQESGTPADLQSQIDGLTAQQELFRLYQKELSDYRLYSLRLKEAREWNEKIQADRSKLELEKKSLGGAATVNVQELRGKIAGLKAELTHLSSQLVAAPPVPVFQELDPSACTRCGQKIPPKLRESADQERERSLIVYNQKAREAEDHNKRIKDRIVDLQKRIAAGEDSLDKALNDAIVKKHTLSNIDSKLAALQPKEIREVTPPLKPEGDEAAVSQKLLELTAKKLSSQGQDQRKGQLITQKASLTEAIDKRIVVLEHLRKLEEALLRLPEIEVKRTLDSLKTPSIFFNIAEGEIEVTDEKHIPFLSLSSGRALKVCTSICRTFQKLLPTAPGFYFIDNADLIDNFEGYLPPGSQVFVAKVDSSLAELVVIPM